MRKKTLRDFGERHKDCERQLESWHKETEASFWKGPVDIKREYPSAGFLFAMKISQELNYFD